MSATESVRTYYNLSNYHYTHRPTVTINIIPVQQDDENLIKRFFVNLFHILKNILVAMIVQHVIIHIYLFFYIIWLYYRYRPHSYIPPQNSQSYDHYYVLTKDEFQKIPYRKTRGSEYEQHCSICLNNYVRNQRLRVLPCEHVYHTKCIERWLTKMCTKCPLCRHDLLDEFPPEKTEINIST